MIKADGGTLVMLGVGMISNLVAMGSKIIGAAKTTIMWHQIGKLPDPLRI